MPPRSPLRAGPLVAALLLMLAGSLPVAPLLPVEGTGPAGAATRSAVEGAGAASGAGGLVLLLVVLGAAFLPSLDRPLAGISRVWRNGVLALPGGAWVLLCAAIAAAGTSGSATLLLEFEPTLVDEMVQLAEARDLAGLQPDLGAHGAAIRLQNGLIAEGEWRSVYPPGQTLLLAAAMRTGLLPWLGTLLWTLTVALSALLFLRIGRGDPLGARIAGLLLAAAPMGWLLGAGSLSHLGAACAIALALLVAERVAVLGSVAPEPPSAPETKLDSGAKRMVLPTVGSSTPSAAPPAPPSPRRPLPALAHLLLLGIVLGGATGWAVTSRPWTGLLLGALLPTLIVVRAGLGITLPVLAGAVAGGLPFLLGLLRWNTARFGSPTRFGYEATFGPAHGLGFHPDPWGNLYGVREALGYTIADLQLLGSSAFASPAPLLLLLATGLLLSARREPARRTSAAPTALPLTAGWIGIALAGNALYWHHGLHFGPRMLFETLPAWALLTGVVATRAAGALAEGSRGRRAVRTALVALVLGTLLLGLPERIRSAGVGEARLAQLPTPEAVASLPDSAVVVVHGSWASRVAARLAESGMRADSIETGLRRNGLCAVSEFADARVAAFRRASRAAGVQGREVERGTPAAGEPEGAPRPPARLDWEPLPGTPGRLQPVESSPGVRFRADPSRPPSAACLREARADRLGGLELEALRWRIARPDIAWLRDLGPSGNRLSGIPLERVRVLVPTEVGGRPEFLGYEEGMRLLW